ncbi:MAG TPA: NUDIX hydrolase [Candidatus Saccharimonadales bacterium]|nr:NUDIX hydrolase [Candidatus Saccharimonadales bacterium]
MNDQNHFRLSIKAIAIDETGRFLLAKEENGMWELLGGGLDHGEDPVECLKREIKEETGLEVIEVSATPKYFVTAPKVGREGFVANVIYEVKLKDLDFKPSDECVELRFFNKGEAAKENLFPQVTEFIKVYNAELHT